MARAEAWSATWATWSEVAAWQEAIGKCHTVTPTTCVLCLFSFACFLPRFTKTHRLSRFVPFLIPIPPTSQEDHIHTNTPAPRLSGTPRAHAVVSGANALSRRPQHISSSTVLRTRPNAQTPPTPHRSSGDGSEYGYSEYGGDSEESYFGDMDNSDVLKARLFVRAGITTQHVKRLPGHGRFEALRLGRNSSKIYETLVADHPHDRWLQPVRQKNSPVKSPARVEAVRALQDRQQVSSSAELITPLDGDSDNDDDKYGLYCGCKRAHIFTHTHTHTHTHICPRCARENVPLWSPRKRCSMRGVRV